MFFGSKRFYARDAINRVRAIDGKRICSSHKQVYDRIERFANPKTGKSCVDCGTLAAELGICDRQVKRLVKDLENMCLLGHDWRDGDRRNSYFFLWHPILQEALRKFEGTFMSPQDSDGVGAVPQFEGTFSEFERTSMSQEPSKPSLKTVASSSERSVKVSTSKQAADQTPARPLPQSQKTNGPDTASASRPLDPHQESHTTEAETTRDTKQTSSPSPAEVDAVRAALKQATAKDSTAGDTLPAELLDAGRKRGANVAVLCRWIVDLAETKLRRGDPVTSHGFFRRFLGEELPGWMRRNARLVDILTPQALSPDTAPVNSITAEEDASPGGPATASPSHCTPVSVRRPESNESWKPPPPPPPPRCRECRDKGYAEQEGMFVRCSCLDGRALDERFLELLNKFSGQKDGQADERRGSGAAFQGTSRRGFQRTAVEDRAQAVVDHQAKEAVAASTI
jgi:hypothetical protein